MSETAAAIVPQDKVAQLPAARRPRGIIAVMAENYDMDPKRFEETLRATVFPAKGGPEELAAFLLVAKEYGLNPLTKEIYAFPTKGGGIQPVVSIDGWCNLINSHPALDGIEFDDHAEGDKVAAISARIWRKDRSKPIVVTEYLAECSKKTEPWEKWPRRMLRHKALIQCARYAFGFAGIVDPDEAERMGADVSPMRDVSPRLVPPVPPVPPVQETQSPSVTASTAGEPAMVWEDEGLSQDTPPTPPVPPVPPQPPAANDGGSNGTVTDGQLRPTEGAQHRASANESPPVAATPPDDGGIPPLLRRMPPKPPTPHLSPDDLVNRLKADMARVPSEDPAQVVALWEAACKDLKDIPTAYVEKAMDVCDYHRKRCGMEPLE